MSLKTVFSSLALLSSVDSVVGLRFRNSLDDMLPLPSRLQALFRSGMMASRLAAEHISNPVCSGELVRILISTDYTSNLEPKVKELGTDCMGAAQKAKFEKDWIEEMDNMVREHDELRADPKNDCRQENVVDMLSLKDEYPTQLLVGEAYAQGAELLRDSLIHADAVKQKLTPKEAEAIQASWVKLSGSIEKGVKRPDALSIKNAVDTRVDEMLTVAKVNWKKRVFALAKHVPGECKTDKELGHVSRFESAVALALYTAEDVFGKLNWMARTGPFAPGADPSKLEDSDYYKTWESLHESLSATLENEMHEHEIAPQPEEPEKFGLWRGLGFPTEALRDTVLGNLVQPVGDFHVFKSQEFMSTSTDREVAERYMSGYNTEQSTTENKPVWSKWNYGILFQIKKNRTGKSIKKYSTWGAEEEVLYRPNTPFFVSEIKKNHPCPSEDVAHGTQLASDKGCVLVVVEEIGANHVNVRSLRHHEKLNKHGKFLRMSRLNH